ncbi:alpha/beta hydrolase [Streptomyces sp. DSM 110735]|uniref:alpha/beta hydrolase n=1 Tax=Streptomyces sp. DSM 110735 TaxID=2775031 RepID=UPI0018F38455|nr:alpha/beta hydrolase [Streptomyces sp. DSM 110735]MBJ7901688.1 alpha/beta fold hydrolase [Streptomyces sp. DSM 110735]
MQTEPSPRRFSRTLSPGPRAPRTVGTRARATAALLVAAALPLTACSATGPTDASAAGTVQGAVLPPLPKATPAALAPYYSQRLSWRACGAAGFQCATFKAPLDYDKPSSGDVKLSVVRKKATGKAKPLGSLLVNPGGPGGSAIDYLQQYAALGYPAEVRARYDMVGMDPRGVGRSDPVECLDGRQMDAFTETDLTPDSPKETDALVAADKGFAESCGAHSARLLRHVSTVEAARDMDILRALLGDQKLNYVGASYGTLLGATYAGLFPQRTGRLVLDGAIDPSLDARQVNLDQTAGFETAFQAFSRDCVKQADCPLNSKDHTPDQVGERLQSFFRQLDAHPLPAGDADGRELGESLATIGVVAAMYDQGLWEQLREALKSAMDEHDGAGLLALADIYYERDAKGHYSNLMMANAAVNCLDLPPAFSGPDQVAKDVPRFRKASPVFGTSLAWASLNCTYWPVKASGTPHRIEAEGAAPIVVVGTTRDPATPYRWAQSLSRQLASGRLLTYEGDGHTAYGRGSTCIDTAIDTYLLKGTPPAQNKRCT